MVSQSKSLLWSGVYHGKQTPLRWSKSVVMPVCTEPLLLEAFQVILVTMPTCALAPGHPFVQQSKLLKHKHFEIVEGYTPSLKSINLYASKAAQQNSPRALPRGMYTRGIQGIKSLTVTHVNNYIHQSSMPFLWFDTAQRLSSYSPCIRSALVPTSVSLLLNIIIDA